MAAGAEVIGISSRLLGVARRPSRGKHNLPMQFVTDEGGKVRAQYGVKSTLGLLPGRETFVIDKAGSSATSSARSCASSSTSPSRSKCSSACSNHPAARFPLLSHVS